MTKNTPQPKHAIRSNDVARIQGAVAKPLGGQIPKGNYVGRMQHAAAAPVASKKTTWIEPINFRNRSCQSSQMTTTTPIK